MHADIPLIEALRSVPLFDHLDDDHLETVAHLGNELWLAAGEALFTEGDPAGRFYILLEGTIQITKRFGNEEVHLNTHHPGAFSGEISLLTGAPSSATGRTLVPSRLLSLDDAAFQQMLATCPNITTRIMKTMAERLQSTEAITRQREKMFALGKLSAGLAHELNNPAAAARRSSATLRETLQQLETRGLQLGQQALTPEHMALLATMKQETAERLANDPCLDPFTQCDREDEVTTWLDEHQVPDGWELADTLVAAGADAAWLERLAAQLPAEAVAVVLQWLVAALEAERLVDEVQQSTTRISDLIMAVKVYSYMDQAPLQETDVHDGIESTLTMLGHRLKSSITVKRAYDRSLPRISAYGSELNQVWMNLLDNALDALGEQPGEIAIRTSQEGECVVVEIGDNGPGIPSEIHSRIFEPFFTTKGVGEGTGLGLDIVYRTVVARHHGDVRVSSQPGATWFRVWLPLQQPESPS